MSFGQQVFLRNKAGCSYGKISVVLLGHLEGKVTTSGDAKFSVKIMVLEAW